MIVLIRERERPEPAAEATRGKMVLTDLAVAVAQRHHQVYKMPDQVALV